MSLKHHLEAEDKEHNIAVARASPARKFSRTYKAVLSSVEGEKVTSVPALMRASTTCVGEFVRPNVGEGAKPWAQTLGCPCAAA
eukprot:3615109-Rhodomonas_salina.3